LLTPQAPVQVRGHGGHGGDDASVQQRGVLGLEHGAVRDGCSVLRDDVTISSIAITTTIGAIDMTMVRS
jgi:hypothetical protein